MAELITTEAEKKAASYLDWDDEALGKWTKMLGLTLSEVSDDMDGFHRVTSTACAMHLVAMAADMNADNLTISLGGMTTQRGDIGDWTLTLTRTKPPESPEIQP